MLRLPLCLALLVSIPGPDAWGQTAALARGSAAGVPAAAAAPAAFPPVAGPAALGAPSLTPSLLAAPALRPAPLPAPVAAVSAAPLAAAVLPAPGAAVALPARAAAAGVPAAAKAARPAAALRAAFAPLAASSPERGASPDSAKTPAPLQDAAAFFDGARAFLSVPGQAPREVALADIEGLLAADGAARGALSSKGRVRIVLAKGAPAVDPAAARAALARLGVDRPVEVESILLEKAKPAAPASGPAVEKAAAPASPRSRTSVALTAVGWATAGGLMLFQTPAAFAAALAVGGLLLAKDLVFVWRQFRSSLSKPSKEEVWMTLLARSWPIYYSATAYVALFLPGHPAQFAAIMALTLGLKALHGFWVDSWATFQDRLARQRSYTYVTLFNLVYGQVTGILFRLLSWSAIPGTVAPWMLSYWRDMGIMTLVGTFFGTLGGQAINDLYNAGVLSRRARSALLVARSTAFDLPGLFFRLGLMKIFWIAFAIQQSLDVVIYLAAQFFRSRAILYIAAPAVAASAEFRGRYALTPEPPLSPARKAMRALVDNPLVMPLAALWRWFSARRAAALAGALALSSAAASDAYAKAASGASFADAAVLSALPVADLELDAEGRPVPVSPRGISKPVFTRFDAASRGIYKPIRMPESDPLYPYERLKIARDVVSAGIMARLGVPTVGYRAARATIDGRSVLGVESPFVPMQSLKHSPELAERIVNSGDFVRGSVIDAWLGNVDRIQNRGNLWVRESPEGPRVIFGDYDQGLRHGLTVFGVPKVPGSVFGLHAAKDPEALRRAVADVLALTDAEISSLVDDAIASMGGFGLESAPYFKAVLIHNRESLRRENPFAELASGRDPPLRLDAAASAALADGVLQGRRPSDAEVPVLVGAALEELISLWDKPAQVEPTRALLERVVRARLAGRNEPVDAVDGGPEMLKVLTNFAYMRLEPAAAMAAGIGYHR
ncbi:MAG: hypothetical protein M0D55_12640 [Elusimicrobiota bacterium]|nr:MAG: hypothetical protein M0D55_12640 [Elusimicrobiota bacterium]